MNDALELDEIAGTLQNAGVAGAGGAGFPAYPKWERLEEIDYLLMNHQESEPNYYKDKYLGREHADEFASFFDTLLDREVFDVIVIGAKAKDRETWMAELEAATDATVYMPEGLPIDPAAESGVVYAYTDDRYEYGMESVLLRIVADVVIGSGLPTEHGWIVHNTESLYNVYRALLDGTPVTRKYVHVDGDVPRHRFLDVPIGTTATDLLAAAGVDAADLRPDQLLVDGGPGWCFEIDEPPDKFGVRKRTNAVLVLDRELCEKNTLGEGRINVLQAFDVEKPHESEPTRVDPEYVRVPLITNPAFEEVVVPSRPIVSTGDRVTEGQMIATPANHGFSIAQHASVIGEVTEVSDTRIEIHVP